MFFVATNAMDWLLRFLPFQQLVSVVDKCMPIFWMLGLFIVIVGSVQEIPKHQADGIFNVILRGAIVLAMIYFCTKPGDKSFMVKGEQLAKTATQAIVELAANAQNNAPVDVIPEKHIPWTDGNGNKVGDIGTDGSFHQGYQIIPAVKWKPADSSWIIATKTADGNTPTSSDLLYDFSAPFDMFEQFIKDSQNEYTLTDAQKTDEKLAGAGLGALKGALAGLKKGGGIGALMGSLLGVTLGYTGADAAANAISPEKIVLFLIGLVANICMFVMEVLLVIQKLILVFDRLILPVLLALLVWQGPIRFVGINFIINVFCVMAWPVGWAMVDMGTISGFAKLYTISLDSSLTTLLILLLSFLLIALWMIIGTLAAPVLITRTITAGASFGAGLVGGAAGKAAQTAGVGASAAATTAGATAGGVIGGAFAGAAGARLGSEIGGSFGGGVGRVAGSLGSNIASSMHQVSGGFGGALPTNASSAAGMAALQGLSQMGQGGGGGGQP